MSASRDGLQNVIQQTGASIWPQPHRVLAEIHREAERRRRPALPRLQFGRPGLAQLRVAAPVVLGALIVAGPIMIAFSGPRSVAVSLRPPVRADPSQTTDPAINTLVPDASPAAVGGVPVMGPPASHAGGNAPGSPRSAPSLPAPPTPRGPCTPADLKVSTTVGDSYSAGQLVPITITVLNTSTVSCPVDPGSCADEARVYDASGALVWSSTDDHTNPCTSTGGTMVDLKPGDWRSVSFHWDQQDCRGGVSGTQCTGSLAPAGHYEAGGIFVAADAAIAARRAGFNLAAVPGR